MSIGTFRFVRYFYFPRTSLTWDGIPRGAWCLHQNFIIIVWVFSLVQLFTPPCGFSVWCSNRPKLLVGSPERVRLEAVVRQRRSRREFYSWWLRNLTGYFQEAATSQVSQTAISPRDWPVHLSVKEWILTLATCGPQVMVSWPDAASGS